MPLRGLFYLSELLQKIVKDENVYRSRKLELPTPRYLVFYNGERGVEERTELRLSDLFKNKEVEPCLEVTATMLNINYGENKELMNRCKTLREYGILIEEVRENLKAGHELKDAVEQAIKRCLRDGMLKDFLSNHSAEVFSMMLYEFDEAKYEAALREEGFEEGELSGRREGELKGRREGELRGRREMLKKLLESMALPEVSRIADIPEDEIKRILEICED